MTDREIYELFNITSEEYYEAMQEMTEWREEINKDLEFFE